MDHSGNLLWIRNATLADPLASHPVVEDVLIRDGQVCRAPFDPPAGCEELDAAGWLLLPGLIDAHTHLREPGHTRAESIESGTRAAACGGFTCVAAMPNTQPPPDVPARVQELAARARGARARVLVVGCISKGRAGEEPVDCEALQSAGVVALSDDGTTPASLPLMRLVAREAARVGLPILDHAEDVALAAGGVMHEGPRSDLLGLPGIVSEAETTIVGRDIELAEATGCHFHIQHISTRRGVELVAEARERGLPVTAEATPHHLALADEDVDPGNPHYKMNPPLRSRDDQQALLEGLASGVISVLATDHAPHEADAKQRGFLQAPFGMVGLETAVPVTYEELVRTGRLSLLDWVRCWTRHPAGLLGLPEPSLADGAPADLALVATDHAWRLTVDQLQSRSHNTPFLGRRFNTRVLATMRAGEWTWLHASLLKGKKKN